jgi:hypothetical protein
LFPLWLMIESLNFLALLNLNNYNAYLLENGEWHNFIFINQLLSSVWLWVDRFLSLIFYVIMTGVFYCSISFDLHKNLFKKRHINRMDTFSKVVGWAVYFLLLPPTSSYDKKKPVSLTKLEVIMRWQSFWKKMFYDNFRC